MAAGALAVLMIWRDMDSSTLEKVGHCSAGSRVAGCRAAAGSAATAAGLDNFSPAPTEARQAMRPGGYPQLVGMPLHTFCGEPDAGAQRLPPTPVRQTQPAGCQHAYLRRTACTTDSRRRRRMTSARWVRSRTWMLKHSTAALKSRSR